MSGDCVFVAVGVYLIVPPPPPPPAPARLHRGDLDLLDRGALRLGHVRAVRARHPPHAVVVAVGHDLAVGCRRRSLGYISYFVTPAVVGARSGGG